MHLLKSWQQPQNFWAFQVSGHEVVPAWLPFSPFCSMRLWNAWQGVWSGFNFRGNGSCDFPVGNCLCKVWPFLYHIHGCKGESANLDSLHNHVWSMKDRWMMLQFIHSSIVQDVAVWVHFFGRSDVCRFCCCECPFEYFGMQFEIYTNRSDIHKDMLNKGVVLWHFVSQVCHFSASFDCFHNSYGLVCRTWKGRLSMSSECDCWELRYGKSILGLGLSRMPAVQLSETGLPMSRTRITYLAL